MSQDTFDPVQTPPEAQEADGADEATRGHSSPAAGFVGATSGDDRNWSAIAGLAPSPEHLDGRDAPQAAGRRHLVFSIGAVRCAGALGEVVEIAEVPSLTWVPFMPEWVCGVANLRGEILAVVDLRTFLGMEPAAAPGRLLVAQGSRPDLRVALQVDAVHGIARITDESLETTEAPVPQRLAPFVRGWRNGLEGALSAVDIAELVNAEEIRNSA